MVGTKLSHYTIDAEIGRGGMGIVYKATDTKLDRTVALKLLPSTALTNQDDRTRFYREAKAAAQLHHPHIASIFEIDEAIPEGASSDDLRPFIAMEFIDGQPLEMKIKEGPMVIEEAIRIATEIAEALKEAHEKDIVHRDIKSANVMLDKHSRAKVLDFGLAKTAQSTMLTRMGSTMGTIAYMSPEQARGNEVDHRTDLWALGVVIYEMVTGTLPFGGDYEQAIVYSIMNEEPEPLTALRTGVPMDLEWITNKLFAKDAAARYNSAADLIVDLKNVVQRPSRISSSSATVHKVASTTSPEAGSAMPIWMLLGLGALLLAGGYFLGAMTGSSNVSPSNGSFRFSLDFPEFREVRYPDFSPDGTSIIFNAVDTSDGSVELHSRDLRDGKTVKMADLSELAAINYSPDGQTLAVTQESSIQLYSPSGQLLSTLEAAANSDLEWSSNKSVLIDPQDGIIREIYLNGDTPTIIAEPDTTKGERFYWWPKILPNTDDLLYSVIMDAADEESEIRILNRKSGESTLLVQGGQHAIYVPSGHLIYSMWDSEQIVAQPFDLSTRTMTGPRVNLFFASMHSVLYHPNHWLLFQPEPQQSSQKVWKLRNPGDAPFTVVSSAKDVSGITNKGTVITLREAGDGLMQLLISDPYSSYEELVLQETLIIDPVFSQSEDQLAFVTDKGGEEHIEVISVSDPTQRQSFPMGSYENIEIYDWTPDSDYLLISSSTISNNAPRYGLLNLQTSEVTPFLDQRLEAMNGQFSPDGKWIAYTHYDNGISRVAVSPRNGSGKITLDEEVLLESWTTNSQALLLNDFIGNRLLRQNLSTSGRVNISGSPSVLFESERFISGHMLENGEILIHETLDDPHEYSTIEVITGANQFLNSIAPPK